MNYHFFTYNKDINQFFFGFYGYGQSSNSFKSFEKIIANDFNLIIFDLPYYDNDLSYNKKNLAEFFTDFCVEYNIKEFSIIAYSIGCRYALCLSEIIPDKIKNVFIIAPDGIRMSYVYLFATRSVIGRFCFRTFLKISPSLISFLYFMHKKYFMNNMKFQFIYRNIRSVEDRKKLYNCWTKMKNIIPDLKLINKQIKNHSFRVISFFGKKDFIIKVEFSSTLKEKIPAAEINIMDSGHSLLTQTLFKQIAAYY